ncbi:GtrA family protein [Paenibacillus odorifer]|uniref:GtrA family protein n=1 Tax=Paenibacillus odorifer TaxID=189426 RepID=UPI00096EE41D|nr:GtrA family protein [Paenibacillus odorifer]OME12882.1 hypothetical protein BSK60_17445 [Paenibacillus odorifer]
MKEKWSDSVRIARIEIMRQFIKYALVGAIGTILHTSILVFLVEKEGFQPLIGSSAGFIASLIVSYYINLKWTFQLEKKKSFFYKYVIVSLSGLGINLLIMFLLVNLLEVWYIWAQVIVIIVVPISNFTLNRYWAFA